MLKERNCGKLYLAVSHLTAKYHNPKLFKLYDKIISLHKFMLPVGGAAIVEANKTKGE